MHTTRKTLFYDAHFTSTLWNCFRRIGGGNFVIMVCDGETKLIFIWILQWWVQLWSSLKWEIHVFLLTLSWYALSIKWLTLVLEVTHRSSCPHSCINLHFPPHLAHAIHHLSGVMGFFQNCPVVERPVPLCNTIIVEGLFSGFYYRL